MLPSWTSPPCPITVSNDITAAMMDGPGGPALTSESMQEAVRAAGGGKLLAFCRSGTRSAMALGLAKREEGASADEVHRCLTEAGFDPGPIAHLL